MSLDPTARLSNVLDSIKKYFVDNITGNHGYQIIFDKSLTTPEVFQTHSWKKWVVINMGQLNRNEGYLIIHIFCCTREDDEGHILAQMTDNVMGYLSDTTQTDSLARIPLYRSRATGAWELLQGGFVVLVNGEFPNQDLLDKDGTKFSVIDVTLRWVAKI